jgi:hypothetical protein
LPGHTRWWPLPGRTRLKQGRRMSSWAALRPWLLSAEVRARTEHSQPNLRRRTEAAIMNSAWSGSFFVNSLSVMGASGHYRQARNLPKECRCQSPRGGPISLAIQIGQVPRPTVKLPCHPSQKPRWHTVQKCFVCVRRRKTPSHYPAICPFILFDKVLGDVGCVGFGGRGG